MFKVILKKFHEMLIRDELLFQLSSHKKFKLNHAVIMKITLFEKW